MAGSQPLPFFLCLVGGLFFSISLWLIICILTSRCKNKVTNMIDPERPTYGSSENPAEPRHHPKGRLADHVPEERAVGSLHPSPETMGGSEIPSTIQNMLPLKKNPDEKGKDSDRCFHSDLRASKSESMILSVGVSLPVLNAFDFKTSGETVFATEDVAGWTSVKVHSGTELNERDRIHRTSHNNMVIVENIATVGLHPVGRSNSHGRKPRHNSENETSEHGEPGIVTYFETHSRQNAKNLSETQKSKTEENAPSTQPVCSNSGSHLAFGKKSKSWSTFCVPHDNKRDINVIIEKEDLIEQSIENICKTEEKAKNSCPNQENQEEEVSKSPVISHTDIRPGSCDITSEVPLQTDLTGGQIILESKYHILESKDHISESRTEEGPCRRQHQWPSKKAKTTTSNERSSLTQEKFWKYHKDCCKEFEPCETASEVLRKLKTLEKRQQKVTDVKKEPPADEDLLEERTSLSLLISEPPESQMMTKSAISPKKTCTSLPNLGVYGTHNPNTISSISPLTEPVVVQDDDQKSYNMDLPIVDLPAGDCASNKRLAEVSSSKMNLPITDFITEGFLKAESGLYDVSDTLVPTGSDVAPRNSASGRDGLGQDVVPCTLNLQVLNVQSLDLVSYNNVCQVLPDTNAPCGGRSREDGMPQVVPSSNAELPATNLQTEGLLRNENKYHISSRNLHLPIIDAPSGDNIKRQNPLQENLPLNLNIAVSEVQAQNITTDEELNVVSLGLADVHILHEDSLLNKTNLPIDIQSEAAVINESSQKDILQCNVSLSAIAEPSEGKALGERKTDEPGKPRGNRNVKAKSCPILSAMLDIENQAGVPNCNRGELKSELEPNTTPVARDPKSSIVAQSETGQEVPSIPVGNMNTCSRESSLSINEQDISHAGIFATNLHTETQLKPSCSYSMSIQDSDEITEWPNTADILKKSSTISLSSKYDILESSTVPQCEGDTVNSAMLDNGHDAVNFRTHGMDNLIKTSVLPKDDNKDEDVNDKTSSTDECLGAAGEKCMTENILHTVSTFEEMSEGNSEFSSEKQITDAQRPPQSHPLDIVMMNDQATKTDLIQMSDLDEMVTHNDSEECRKESLEKIQVGQLADLDCHQFSLVLNGQKEDDHEDPSKDVASSLNTKVETSQLEFPGNNIMMEYLETIGAISKNQIIHNLKHNDTLTECFTSDLDVSRFSHEENSSIDIGQSDDLAGNKSKSLDILTCNQQKVKHNHQEDGSAEDNMKETCVLNSEDHSNLHSNLPRGKEVTNRIRKNIGSQKLEANKTFRSGNLIAQCSSYIRQDIKDYISSRPSRRPFQSVFPISITTPCPEDGNKLKASSLEEHPFDNGTKTINRLHVLSSTSSQSNVAEMPSEKMTDAIKYLTHLYARSQRVKILPDSHVATCKDDTTVDDIRVLANLQFCKVSGGFIVDTEIRETVRGAPEDPKVISTTPNNPYLPPSKEELKADEELAVLNIMCTLKRSLELSLTDELDDGTDT